MQGAQVGEHAGSVRTLDHFFSLPPPGVSLTLGRDLPAQHDPYPRKTQASVREGALKEGMATHSNILA